MEIISKSKIVEIIAESQEITKAAAKRQVEAVLDVIKAEVVKGNKVALSDFGSFQSVERKARTGLNPQTKEKIAIPACNAVAFKSAKAFKEAVNPAKAAAPAPKKDKKKKK